MKILREPDIYIDGDKNKGIEIDWKKVLKYYKQLGCPENVYNPSKIPFANIRYSVQMSTRSTGKTTTWLLIGLILSCMYDNITAYVRQAENMIEYKEIKGIYNTIIAHNYVSKMTDGEYTGIEIKGDYAYMVHYDERMKVDKRSNPVCFFGAISKQQIYKSSLVLPTCYLIIFDEFISKWYAPNEFVEFMQLCSTLLRKKKCVRIALQANSIDLYNEYLAELEIRQDVQKLKQNESCLVKTAKGTVLYVELIGDRSIEREELNMLYFGFNNPKLGAITGGDWVVDEYPHIEREERQVLSKDIYLLFNAYIVQLEICYNERLGKHILAHQAKTIDNRAIIIYTIEEIKNKAYKYRYGTDRISRIIWQLFDRHLFFYSNNEVGNVVEQYVNRCEKLI